MTGFKVAILLSLWCFFVHCDGKQHSKKENRILINPDCRKNNVNYKESDFLKNVWFLRLSSKPCDSECKSAIAEPFKNGKLNVYFMTAKNGTSVRQFTRIGNTSQYNFKSQIGGPKLAMYNIPKITSDYYVAYINDNNRFERVDVWTSSPFGAPPKITSGCAGNRLALKDCEAERNCKGGAVNGGPNAQDCLIDANGFQEQTYVNTTWFLKYSTEKCNSVCTIKIPRILRKKLVEYRFEGYGNLVSTMEYTRLQNTTTYSFESQNGGESDGLRSIAEMRDAYTIDYSTDHGQETIEVFASNPFVSVAKKPEGCGSGVKFNDCRPEVSCLRD